MSTTGQRLRETRQYLGYTIEQVCNFCHLSATWMTEIELGQVEPNPAQLARLANLYQRPATWFTGNYDDEPPSLVIALLVEAASDLCKADAEELEKFAQYLRLRKAARADRKGS